MTIQEAIHSDKILKRPLWTRWAKPGRMRLYFLNIDGTLGAPVTLTIEDILARDYITQEGGNYEKEND